MSSHQGGLGHTSSSEAVPGALAVRRITPQRCPYGMYPEQRSKSAFYTSRADSCRSRLHCILPSAMDWPFERIASGRLPSIFRELPTPQGNGKAAAKNGAASHSAQGVLAMRLSGYGPPAALRNTIGALAANEAVVRALAWSEP